VSAVLVLCLMIAATARADVVCPAGARCATVTVPLDRANSAAGTIDIAYALLPHTDRTRPALGTVAPNPGGPGSPTISDAETWSGLLGPLHKRRDLLLIDARGTGQSGALSCPSLVSQDLINIDLQGIAKTCGADLGLKGRYFGSAAIADDFDAVRAALGIDKLDLWGESWGTLLMPIYAARHPGHVRSIVLSGAQPVRFDPFTRDVLRASKRAIGLVCRRTHACSGKRALRDLGVLVRRVSRHPVRFTAPTPEGPVRFVIGERELAELTYARGIPMIYGLFVPALSAAVGGDYAPLKRLVATFRMLVSMFLTVDPSTVSYAQLTAAGCHDYPSVFDLAAPPARRRVQYRRALDRVPRSDFAPFRPAAWFQSQVWGAPTCLDWPIDPTAGSPLQGRKLPDVPVLVQSGDLDTNTPIEQGRLTARQFPHATFAVIKNAAHTPDGTPCGVKMIRQFIATLRTNPLRCRNAGRPPVVALRPALRAADLPGIRVRAPAAVRRVVAVALATVADAKAVTAIAPIPVPLSALRGGTYVPTAHGLRFARARVVTDAVASGSQITRSRVTVTRLRLRGPAVVHAQLTLLTAGPATRITGMVGRRRVHLRLTMR
jgi:pimeloyl-ACP methyl ester carboxylesterase